MLHTFPLRLIDIQRLFYLDSFEYRCIYIFFSFTRFPIRFHSILLVSTIIITTYVHPWLLIQFFPLRVNKSIDEIKKERKEKILYLFSNWNKKKKKREGSKWLARFLIKRDKVNFAARLPSTNWPYSEGGRGLFRVVSLERACSKDGRERRRRRRSKARAKFVTVHTVKTPFFRERRRRRRFLLNKIKYQVIVPERRKAAIRRSLSTSFSKPAPSLSFFFFFIFHPSFQGSFVRPEISFPQGWRCFSTRRAVCAMNLSRRDNAIRRDGDSCARKFGFVNFVYKETHGFLEKSLSYFKFWVDYIDENNLEWSEGNKKNIYAKYIDDILKKVIRKNVFNAIIT